MWMLTSSFGSWSRTHRIWLERAAQLMKAVEQGEVVLRVTDIIVAEVVWVLHSFYRYEPHKIATTMLEFLAQDGIEADEDVLSALVLYSSKGIDLVDALLAVRMQRAGIRQVYSFDRHFDRVAGLERVQP